MMAGLDAGDDRSSTNSDWSVLDGDAPGEQQHSPRGARGAGDTAAAEGEALGLSAVDPAADAAPGASEDKDAEAPNAKDPAAAVVPASRAASCQAQAGGDSPKSSLKSADHACDSDAKPRAASPKPATAQPAPRSATATRRGPAADTARHRPPPAHCGGAAQWPPLPFGPFGLPPPPPPMPPMFYGPPPGMWLPQPPCGPPPTPLSRVPHARAAASARPPPRCAQPPAAADAGTGATRGGGSSAAAAASATASAGASAVEEALLLEGMGLSRLPLDVQEQPARLPRSPPPPPPPEDGLLAAAAAAAAEPGGLPDLSAWDWPALSEAGSSDGGKLPPPPAPRRCPSDGGTGSDSSSECGGDAAERERQARAARLEADIRAASQPPRVRAARSEHWHKLLLVGPPSVGKTTLLRCLLPSGAAVRGAPPDACPPDAWAANPGAFAATVRLEDAAAQAGHTFVLQDSPGDGDWLRRAASHVRACQAQWREQEQEAPGSARGDPRVDACLCLIPPHRFSHAEAAGLAALSQLAPVVPVMAKADSMTAGELAAHRAGIKARLDACGYAWQALPPAVLHEAGAPGSGIFALVASTELEFCVSSACWPVRKYPWGTVEAMSRAHSDLLPLRRLLFEAAPAALAAAKAARSRRPARLAWRDALRTGAPADWARGGFATRARAGRTLTALLSLLVLLAAAGSGLWALHATHSGGGAAAAAWGGWRGAEAAGPPPAAGPDVSAQLAALLGEAPARPAAALRLLLADLAEERALPEAKRRRFAALAGQLAAASAPAAQECDATDAPSRRATSDPPGTALVALLRPRAADSPARAPAAPQPGGAEPLSGQSERRAANPRAASSNSTAAVGSRALARLQRAAGQVRARVASGRRALRKRLGRGVGRAAARLLRRLERQPSLQRVAEAVRSVDGKRLLRRVAFGAAWL